MAASSPLQPQQSKQSTQCLFFLSKKGCRNGNACRFSHATQNATDAPSSSVNPTAPSSASTIASTTPPPSSAPATRGSTPIKPPSTRAPVRKPVPKSLQNVNQEDAATSLRAFEISQIQSRFGSTFIAKDDTIFQLRVLPSDPDFPYEIESLHVQLTVPKDYPRSCCSVQVLNKDIPKGFAFNLERGFAEAALQKKSLLAHLNWLDANMEQLLQKPPAPTIRFVGHGSQSIASPPATTTATTTTAAASQSPSLPPPLPKTTTAASSSLSSSSGSSSNQPNKQAGTQNKKPSHPPKPSPRTLTPTEIEQAGLQRQKQLNQIQARFRSSFEFVSQTNIRISLESADKDRMPVKWQGPLWVDLIIPKLFPLEACYIRLKEDDHNPEIESWRAKNVAQGFQKIAAANPQLSLFQLLNQFNRDLREFMNMPQQSTSVSTSALTSASLSSTSQEADSQIVEQNSSTPKKQAHVLFKEQDDAEQTPRLIYVDASPQIGRRNFDQDQDQGMVTSEDDEDDESEEGSEGSESESDSDSENVNGETRTGDEEEDEEDDDEDESHQVTTATTAGTDGPTSESSPKRGIEIRMPDLKLDNISLLYCRSLSLLVRCNRCKGLFDIPDLLPDDGQSTATVVKSGSDKRKWKTCDNCQSLLGAHFRTEYIHIQSRTIGYLDLAGCTAFDLLPSVFVPTCGECDQVHGAVPTERTTVQDSLIEDDKKRVGKSGISTATKTTTTSHSNTPLGFRQRVGRGMSATANCRQCHVRMTFTMEGEIKFVKLSPGDLMKASATTLEQLPLKKKLNRHNKSGLDFELKVGEPLPRKGACDHYKKSRRWFRFPCCSKVYPCHLCHDEKEADSHECEYAKRMICGHCSREQTVSDKACVCGESPIKTVGGSGAYWEGGQGMRDKTRMSHKDPHKYRGANKTVAKKQVGAENVRKRAPKN
ncbi:hypothetical protein BGX28_005366 [Mortierella sp. GBA30]|nr:hypothetical protein BGX28_005366 [Mortierella sp. GBA30]